jgi:LysR family cys regulon transcriptional activator
MKLQQLRYLIAIVENGLNITAASERLYTSQPGVSKQLRLLEDELGLRLFVRNGKTLVDITPEGQLIIDKARIILREMDNIKELATDLRNESMGTLSIGTTHTQARYVLPDVIQKFQKIYPDVKLDIQHGTSEQISEMVSEGSIDFAIASNSESLFADIVRLPWYEWDRVILTPKDHPLTNKPQVTLDDLVEYSLITYVFSKTDPSTFKNAFEQASLTPNVTLTARDADVIKAYVRKNMGVGIVAAMAYEREFDTDLQSIDCSQLFPRCTTWIGFSKDHYLRSYMYEFLNLLAPHLDRYYIKDAIEAKQQNKSLPMNIKLEVKGHQE